MRNIRGLPGHAVPMLAVSRKYLQRGVIVVKTPPAVRSQFKATGLRVLDASAGSLENLDPVSEAETPGRDRRESDVNNDVHAFAFSEPGARLELFRRAARTHAGSGCCSGSFARDLDRPEVASLCIACDCSCTAARLTRWIWSCRRDVTGASAPRRHGCRADRVRDGRFDTTARGEPGCEVVHDQSSITSRGTRLARSPGECDAVLPAVSFPCLSFTWELVAPGGYEAVDCGPGLVAAEWSDRWAGRTAVSSSGDERGSYCEARRIA